jgi:adenylate kinase
MLRQARRDSAIGKLIASYIDTGRLAPDHLVMPIVTSRLAAPDCRRGCLFDGFPRTVAQAEQLDRYLADHHHRVDVVLHLDVAPNELVRRLLHRATIEHRDDDTESTITARLNVFHDQTAPVLDYYRRRGMVESIDGMHTPDQVFTQILACVNAHH